MAYSKSKAIKISITEIKIHFVVENKIGCFKSHFDLEVLLENPNRKSRNVLLTKFRDDCNIQSDHTNIFWTSGTGNDLPFVAVTDSSTVLVNGKSNIMVRLKSAFVIRQRSIYLICRYYQDWIDFSRLKIEGNICEFENMAIKPQLKYMLDNRIIFENDSSSIYFESPLDSIIIFEKDSL